MPIPQLISHSTMSAAIAVYRIYEADAKIQNATSECNVPKFFSAFVFLQNFPVYCLNRNVLREFKESNQ